METIKAMATTQDFQIWIERVGQEPFSIVIEEGEVKGKKILKAHNPEKAIGVVEKIEKKQNGDLKVSLNLEKEVKIAEQPQLKEFGKKSEIA